MCPCLLLPSTAERLHVSVFEESRLMITAEVNDQQIFLVNGKVEELKGEEAIRWGQNRATHSVNCIHPSVTLLSFQCSEGSVDPGKVRKERIYWRKLSSDILLRLLSILCSILCRQSSACISMQTAYLTLFDVSRQTCLSQHFGRRAKTRSSILRGYSCCPVKTSPSNTSSKRMLVVFLLYYHLIFISVPYF